MSVLFIKRIRRKIMGRRNAEGYYDPTAYAGINFAEPKKENQTVRLTYRNGRMELYIHEFFPCTAAVARRVFPLIRRFAGEEDKAKLRKYLLVKVQEHSGRMQDFSIQAGKCPEKSKGWHFYRAKAREEQMLYNQAKKNLEFLENGGRRK
nr:MAG TPA: hypothetical protein [Caudoviricetes sp.]